MTEASKDGRWPAPFDPTGKLTPGITLIEASAGTGKTYNITTLVLRLIAEQDLTLDQILVVTFTRAATAELKVRIHRRIAAAASVLRGEQSAKGDPVFEALLMEADKGGPTRRRQWALSLQDALECFDTAPIFTIHGFCQRMLQQNAFESDAEFGLDLETDTSDLLEQIAADYLSAELHDVDRWTHDILTRCCGHTPQGLLELGRAATSDPEMEISPAPPFLGPQDWVTAVSAFQDLWSEQADAALSLLDDACASKALDGKTYQKKKTAKNRQAVERWLEHRSVCRTEPGASPEQAPVRSEEGAYRAICDRRGIPPGTLRGVHGDAECRLFGALGGQPLPLTAPLLTDAVCRYFSAWQIRDKAKTDAGARVAEHPLFGQWEDLLGLMESVRAGPRACFAGYARKEVDQRNARRNAQTYQDLLRRLARVLRDPGQKGGALASAIRRRFTAALIDEFQDTDGLQWQIFSTVFSGDQSYLYLIGDPKQAIYGFRGANIHVYHAAKAQAGMDRAFTMTTNYRSDEGYVAALNHLLDHEGTFGDQRIQYVEVDTPQRDPVRRLRWPGGGGKAQQANLQVHLFDSRLMPGTPLDTPASAGQVLSKGDAWRLLPGRVAEDIVWFLQQGAEVFDQRLPGLPGDRFRAVAPGDIAVLVRKNKQATEIQQALRRARVPSVQANTGSVFETEEAQDLNRWLDAVTHPNHPGLTRGAAVGALFGWGGDSLLRLAAEDGLSEQALEVCQRWERWIADLLCWRRDMESQGFYRTFRGLLHRHDVPGRLLARPDGERRLTNFLHLAELLHRAEQEHRLRAPGLAAWLEQQRQDKPQDLEAAQIRLESDDAAVRVVTMHRSKGLEYPIVWAPYLWDGRLQGGKEHAPLQVPAAEDPIKRVLSLHGDSRQQPRRGHLERARQEAQQENLRLLYVSLTRALLRCEIYWGAVKENETSPLAAVLHGDASSSPAGIGRQQRAAARVAKQNLDALLPDLEALANSSSGTISLVQCTPCSGLVWQGAPAVEGVLQTRPFSRQDLHSPWGQTSYSALTRNPRSLAEPASDPPGEDPTRPGFDPDGIGAPPADHIEAVTAVPAPPLKAPGPPEQTVKLAQFPAGAEAGTFLHAVLERFDFRLVHPQGDARAGEQALKELLGQQMPAHGIDPGRHLNTALVHGLVDALRTPLGGVLDNTRLCDIPPQHRLNEMHFHFPLAGGLDWGGPDARAPVRSEQISAALQRPEGDEALSTAYLQSLGQRLPAGRELAGFMTGFIDLVFQAAPAQGSQQWFIADYKSNRIGPASGLTADHFCYASLRHEMEQHHYHLQYHLYAVALHRYLGWRLGERYDYEEHFGGVYYLFLRGMTAPPQAPPDGRVPGVFFDRPPGSVVEQMSRLLDDPPPPGGPR